MQGCVIAGAYLAAEALGEWVDGCGLLPAFFGLHSIGRLVRGTAPRRRRSVCRLGLVRLRAFSHAQPSHQEAGLDTCSRVLRV